MSKKKFTITLETNNDFTAENQNFEPFELIGIFTYLLDKEKSWLFEKLKMSKEQLEKEMD